MSDWTGVARSNSFKVRDREAFLEWMSLWPEIERFVESDGSFALVCNVLPSSRELDADNFDDDDDDDDDGDLDDDVDDEESETEEPEQDASDDALLEDSTEESKAYFGAELAAHLAPGEVAVFMEVGGLGQHITGRAYAVNAQGQELKVDLLDIYPLVQAKWNVELAPAKEHRLPD